MGAISSGRIRRPGARCSPHGTSFGRSVQPRPPNSGGDGGPTYLRGGGFLPSRKCLGAPSPPTPLNGYTFTLFRRHLRQHGCSSIRLQTIHMHHSERLVSFPAHDDSSSIQYFGDERRAEPRELQLQSPVFVPELCRESILYCCSHVFDATPPVATPHRRAGTRLAILPGVRPHTRSPCFLPLPAPGVPHT